jgi:hypothetical protein
MPHTILPFPSPNRSPRIPGDPIDTIVLHATVGTFDSSLGWLRNPKSRVSTHYLIRKDGLIAQLVDETEQALHAGVSFWRGRTDLNRYSIGIELENVTNAPGEAYPDEQREALAWLILNIHQRRSAVALDRAHIVRHLDIAPRRKHDPQYLDMNDLFRRIGGENPQDEHRGEYWVVVSRANVRQGPGTGFPVAGQLQRGQKVYIDKVVMGEKIGGSWLWAHMERRPPEQFDIGFIHLNLLRKG